MGMSSFLENIRLNEDLKEKLYSASDKALNYFNERPLWERFRSLDEFYFRKLKILHYRDRDESSKSYPNSDYFKVSNQSKVKLTVGTSLVSYIYIRYKWTALNGCGVEIIPPKLSSIGTMNQYFGTDTYVQWVSFTFISEKVHSFFTRFA